MRNDSDRWPTPRPTQGIDFTSENLTIRRDPPVQQTLISGPLDAAINFANVGLPNRWPDVAQGDRYLVSMRRDRVLAVNASINRFGWIDPEGLAISDATAAYTIISVIGSNALEVLRTGTELSLKTQSNSAVRLWNGYDVLLYRFGNEQDFRLHVPSALQDSVVEMLERQARLLTF